MDRNLDRRWLLLVAGGVSAIGVAQLLPGGPVLLLAVGVAALVAVVAHMQFDNLVVAFIWSTSLVHLLKRVIFLTGPQPRAAYYTVVFIPTLLLGVTLIRRPRGSLGLRSAPAGAALGLFIALAALSTVSPTSGVPIFARMAALNERLVPALAFLVGMALPVGSRGFARATRAIVISALATIPYGLLQLIIGPGPIERAWATNTAGYSIQAQKIVDYVARAPGSDWRPFSYYADPLTWGLFLLVALGVTLANRRAPDGIRVPLPAVTVPLLLVGLFASFSRTPWLGALGMVSVFVLLHWRSARRPVLLLALLLGLFAIGINVGTYLYKHVFPRVGASISSSNVAESRYLNLGTLQARLDSWSELPKDIAHYPLVGAGYGRLALATQQFGQVVEGDPGKHNLLVETVVAAGAAGLALLLAFFGALFAAGLRAPPPLEATARWLIGLIFGLFITGYGNVGVFLDANFFLLCGVIACFGLASVRGRGMVLDQRGQPVG